MAQKEDIVINRSCCYVDSFLQQEPKEKVMESSIKYLKMYLFVVVLAATHFLEGIHRQEEPGGIKNINYIFNFSGQEISGDIQYPSDSMHFVYAFEGDWTPFEMLSGLMREAHLFSLHDSIESGKNKEMTVQYFSQALGLCFEGRMLYAASGEKLEEKVLCSHQASFFDDEESVFVIPNEEMDCPMTITFLFDGGKMVEMDVQQITEMGEDPASCFQEILISNLLPLAAEHLPFGQGICEQEYQSFLRDRKCGFWGDVWTDVYEGTCAFGRKAWEWIKENKDKVVRWFGEVIAKEDPKDKKNKNTKEK